jgi:hypothetical protein
MPIQGVFNTKKPPLRGGLEKHSIFLKGKYKINPKKA